MNNSTVMHTQMSKNQKLVLLSSSSGFGLENMDVQFLAFTMIAIISQFHVSASAAGMIGTITSWGMLVGGILFGVLGDRLGRVKTFTYTILIFAVATALMGFANNIHEVYLLRFITGIGGGGEYGLGITLIAEAFPQKELGRMSSICAIGGQVGALLAAILAAIVIPAYGWHALFLFGLIPVVLIFFVRKNLTESETFKQSKAKQEITTGQAIRKYMFNDWHTTRQSLGLMVMTTVHIAGYFGLMNWLPSIVREQNHLSVSSSSLFMIATIIGMSLGMMTFGLILDKIGPRKSFGIFLVASAISVFSLLMAHSTVQLLIIGAIVGFFSNGMYGGFGAVVSQLYPTEVRSSANNIIVGVGRAIGGMSSLIIGFIMDYYNLFTVMAFLSILYIISFLVMLTIPGIKQLSQKA
ncbi:MFS transporter [Fructilactobacillus sp. Tb1]|uniref:MFS transporter n=1 Tax=Fructilactobacillus sp. Tb1 TaxID=3422304 RepID=UPI003D2BA2BE